MHVTLHLTTVCNMRCGYCYAPPEQRVDMTPEVARQAARFARETSENGAGVIFYGGEPLLKKDLIFETIAYCDELQEETGKPFHFKVTTNGLLLDEAFLERADAARLNVALSCDGMRDAHDAFRVTSGGHGTHETVAQKLELLLSHQPYAPVLMTLNPETVRLYSDSVKFLFEKGVKYLLVAMNYAGPWTDAHIRELEKQYKRLARLYEEMILAQKKFYFSPIDTKLATHIRPENARCERCHLGMKQVSIAPNGDIYPCVQFVGNASFLIGNVWDGIDAAKRDRLFEMSEHGADACRECAMAARCNNRCGCQNHHATGSLSDVPAALCASERALTPIADRLGERLYKKRAPMFIQKHYNDAYPLLSLFEDMGNNSLLDSEIF